MANIDATKDGIRADILARREPFTFAEAVADAERKYGPGEPKPNRPTWSTAGSTYRIVDAQLQYLRRKGLIKTQRIDGRPHWMAVRREADHG